MHLVVIYLLQVPSFLPITDYDSYALKWTKGQILKELWKKKLKIVMYSEQQNVSK